MNNPWVNYYTQQSGGAVRGFQGMRKQRGYGYRRNKQIGKGLFGNLATFLLPFITSMGKKAIQSQTVRKALTKDNLIKLASTAADIVEKNQEGKGIKRKRCIRKSSLIKKHGTKKQRLRREKDFLDL